MPQDILLLVKLLKTENQQLSYPTLSSSLGISPNEVHASIKRLRLARLLRDQTLRPVRLAAKDVLIKGVPYFFPAHKTEEMVRGWATAHSARPLCDVKAIREAVGTVPAVWPDQDGDTLGQAVFPLCPEVPLAARNDRHVMDCMTLLDAIRVGNSRERSLAASLLQEIVLGESGFKISA